MLMVLGLAMAASFGVSMLYGDPLPARKALGASALLSLAVGALMARLSHSETELSRRDGILVVTIGWFIACLFGALPYVLSGVIPDPVGAVFETVSGFTTTGASVLAVIDPLPKGILFWRALTHFLGGMGVLVLCVAILPFIRTGGMQIFRAEMTGPTRDRLTPRIANTAKLLWGIYTLLCVIETLLLKWGGMTWFDAVCHSFATVATGGFSTRTSSIAAFNSVYIEIVVIVFMLLGAINFNLHLAALRGNVLAYFRDSEWRCYLSIWLASGLFIAWNIWRTVYPEIHEAIHHSFFSMTSLFTTTGFCTVDFDRWPIASKLVLLLLMVMGGCAGSTAGGIKQIRVVAVIKNIYRELKLFTHPNAVISIKIDRHVIGEEVNRSMLTFFLLYLATIVAMSLALNPYMPDIMSSFSAVIATMGGVGPGLSAVGPIQNYGFVASPGKIMLIFCMLLGRLEFYTLLVLCSPGFWRK